MASQVTPKKNAAFRMFVSLVSQANVNIFQVNPTLAAGDVKVMTDGGSINNITTLPSAISSSALLQLDLSASEMNGDNITVKFSDAAGAEWCDLVINIQTTAQQIDDLAFATQISSAVADSVPADGSRPSIAQAVYMLVQFLTERSVSGTTMTVKKPDGTTSLMTFTLNDPTNPTSLTRAT